MLAKSKLNSIETLVSPPLIDMDIIHEEFATILMEKGKYEKMKDNLRSENEKFEIEQCEIKDVSEKLLSISCHQKKFFFLCVYKMVKSAKKDIKNVKLKLLTQEDTFG